MTGVSLSLIPDLVTKWLMDGWGEGTLGRSWTKGQSHPGLGVGAGRGWRVQDIATLL